MITSQNLFKEKNFLLVSGKYYSVSQVSPLVRNFTRQVAQLWQRNLAKLETFSINVHRYSQNHAQNCIFGSFCVRIGGNVSGLFDSFNAKKFCSGVSSRECQFYSQNNQLAFLSHPLGGGV